MTEAHVLSEPTLVLNRSWFAITTTTVRRALSLVASEAARVIRPDTYAVHGFDDWATLPVPRDEPCVRTASHRIRVPEVIVLSSYDGVPAKEMPFTRRNLFKRDVHTCQYCGRRPGTSHLTIDHVLPRSRGGTSSWQNCVLACVDCNHRKANRTPTEAGMALSRTPKTPAWTHSLELPEGRRREAWSPFVSDKYWDVPLEP